MFKISTLARNLTKAKPKVLIFGGGPAGRVVAHTLEKKAPGKFETFVLKNEVVNANRCGIPYGAEFVNEIPTEKFCIPNSLITDANAEIIFGNAESVNLEDQIVEFSSLESPEDIKEVQFDYLVFAAGAEPTKPKSMKGLDLEGITTVRGIESLETLRGWGKQEEKGKLTVIGGGFIGIETAISMKKHGWDTTIVQSGENILQNTCAPEFIDEIHSTIEENGINIITGKAVAEFQGNNNELESVLLSDGTVLESDKAILAAGVSPRIFHAQEAGLDVSSFGITTNEYLQTIDAKTGEVVPNVYAIGDCAGKLSHITNNITKGEFGTNAVFMGKVAAKNILGKEEKFPGVINASCATSYEYSFGSAGLLEDIAQQEGIETVVGFSEVLSGYPMMPKAKPVKTKVIFDKKTKKLIGGTVLRKDHSVAGNIDLLSFAIQNDSTMEDLLIHQYSTHPELSAKPSDNWLVFATLNAMENLQKQ